MPPAFNLSQDQTLQFDLVCLALSCRNPPDFLRLGLFGSVERSSVSALCPSLASPQNPTPPLERPRLSAVFCERSPTSPPATISQARYSSTAFLRKPALPHTFFHPLLVPFLAPNHNHGPQPTLPTASGGGTDCSMACSDRGREFAAPRKRGTPLPFKPATCPAVCRGQGCHSLQRVGGSRGWLAKTPPSSQEKTSTCPWSRSLRCAVR